MAGIQKNKPYLTIKTPLGDELTLNSFQGTERLSDLFTYTITMASSQREIELSKLIGQDVTIYLNLSDKIRYFHGIIGEVEQDGTPSKSNKNIAVIYRAKIYPKLWLLTHSSNCRIFQNQSTREIIKSILQENSIKFEDKLTTVENEKKREYCVQYNESDFDFISRLMEEEGIFYYFNHTITEHLLILADALESHQFCEHAEAVKMLPSFVENTTLMGIFSCNIIQNIVPKSTSLTSYNYLTPKTKLKADQVGVSQAGGGSIYHYPGNFDLQNEGESLVKLRMQSHNFLQHAIQGSSTVPYFLSGGKFKLQNHSNESANKNYILYEVYHEAKITTKPTSLKSLKNQHYGPGLYVNRFKAFPASIVFRPFLKTLKPRIYGTQTAVVTGKKEEEIYTEQYGRIKVKFHWDIKGPDDENSSCWLRVSYPWAGQGWGMLSTPRVGHEVVVSFLDGDPDKPIVVGSVYNGENKPPNLPDNPTKSTIKSQSSKQTEGETPGFNEFTFEDKKGEEQIYLHAQKDMKIDIQNNQEITLTGGSRIINIQAAAEKGEAEEQKKGNDTLTLVNGDKTLTITKGNYSIQLTEGNMVVKLAKGDLSFDVEGNISFNCTGTYNVKAEKDIELTATQNIKTTSTESTKMTAGTDFGATSTNNMSFSSGALLEAKAAANVELEAGATMNVKSAAAMSLEAGASFSAEASASASLSAGGSTEIKGGGTCTMNGAMVEITGAMVTING